MSLIYTQYNKTAEGHYVECHFICYAESVVRLSVIMLSVVKLSVIILSVVALPINKNL